jgi:hypothetical protein
VRRVADGEDTRGPDFAWHVARRVQEIRGEARANVLRAIGVALFYGVELAAAKGVKLGFLELAYDRPEATQQAITAVCGAWALMALAVLAALRQRFVPPWLKFATTLADVAFLTAVLTVSAGPRSPMTTGYFLLVGMAALRMSLPLVRVATAASVLGYLWLLGFAKWFAKSDLTIPRYHQVVFALALVFLGVVLGQVMRRARAVAEDYAQRRDNGRQGDA